MVYIVYTGRLTISLTLIGYKVLALGYREVFLERAFRRQAPMSPAKHIEGMLRVCGGIHLKSDIPEPGVYCLDRAQIAELVALVFVTACRLIYCDSYRNTCGIVLKNEHEN